MFLKENMNLCIKTSNLGSFINGILNSFPFTSGYICRSFSLGVVIFTFYAKDIKTQLKVEDSHDAYQIGKVNNESLKIIDSAVEKKLMLAKLQAQILMNNNQSEEKVNTPKALSDEDKKLLRDMMKEQKIKKDVDYDV